MNNAILSSTILAVVFLVAALTVVWVRRRTWFRGAAIPLALAATVGSAGVIGSALGYAVPLIAGITAPAGDHDLLALKLRIDDGIYTTLDLPDGPRLFWLPWDKKLAEKLQEMEGDPGNAGVKVKVPPFEWSWDIDRPPDFQPIPQPKVLPDKIIEDAPPAPSFAA